MAKIKYDLNSYKKSIKKASTPTKKDSFIVMDDALHEVLGLPGPPLGHITQIYGLSDTGKSSLLFHGVAEAQRQNILPVVIITEGKVSWDRARSMGIQYTGDLPEEEQQEDFIIVEDDLDFLEDVFEYIDKIISDVGMGILPYDVMIFWDSVGNTLSKDEVSIQKDGTWEKKQTMMKAAKVITERMRVISKKINQTRKISYPNSVGLTIVNQAYTEPPAFPGGPSKLIPYGGKSIWFRSSLVLKTAKKQKLSAIKDNKKYGYGIVSKITVDKNHISATTNEGEFVITADTILPNDPSALKSYKENNKGNWGTDFIIEEEEGE